MGACGMPSEEVSESVITGMDQSIWELVAQGLESSNKGVRSLGRSGGGRMSGPSFGRGMMGMPAPGPDSSSFKASEHDRDEEVQSKATEILKQNARIVGGSISKPDTWPWQTHLTICGKWYGFIECNVCGASIIRGVAYKLSSLLH